MRRLAQCTGGGLAVIFALSAPVLIGSAGIAVDFINLNRVKVELQAAADAAAIAGAREMQVAKSDDQQITSAAISYAAYKLTGNSSATAAELQAKDLTVAAEVLDATSSVRVNITERWTPFFAHFLQAGITPVRVSATARFVGSNNVCVLGLSSSGRAVYMDRNARITGNRCGIYSNSTAADGYLADVGVRAQSSLNCVAGGASVASSASVSPKVLTDCPVVADPLANRPPPSVVGCDFNGLSLSGETRKLNPGVYCGGINITSASDITLNPGTYIMNNGGLNVGGQSTLRGDGVSFFITGNKAGKINFSMSSHIALSAPTGGAMAGLLFYEDRTIRTNLNHRISSNDARKLVGTIYLPVSSLIIDARDPVADQSAYTAIIVNKLELNMGPNLVLNTDYESTKVPVPEGIKGTSQVVLTQ